jgi:hypothetical protein
MRTQSEQQDNEEQQSLPSSPISSAPTAVSGNSLGLGLQYRGAWCTPPRIFVDQVLTSLIQLFKNFKIVLFVISSGYVLLPEAIICMLCQLC